MAQAAEIAEAPLFEAGQTWLSLIPAVEQMEHDLAHAVGQSLLFNKTVHDVHHVTVGFLVFIFIIFAAFRFRSALKNDENGGIIPEARFNLRSIFEVVTDYTLNVMTGIMGAKAARHFLPFIGTFAFFILFSNLIGLFPGFLPPPDSLNTPVPCAVKCII